jgi:hypothetical protein
MDVFDAARLMLVVELAFPPHGPRQPLFREGEITPQKVLAKVYQLERCSPISSRRSEQRCERTQRIVKIQFPIASLQF